MTNYYYDHSDGLGNRSINYANTLPQNRIFQWVDTKRFRIYQMLTIHSCTFRTETMRKSSELLPKNILYEDNLMVYKTLPYVQKLYYMNIDLYRYWIGRPDQSVQQYISMKRYYHQIFVTEKCFTVCHLDEVAPPQLKRYMKHELFMMLGISIFFTRLNRTSQTDADLKKMWETCRTFDPKWAKLYKNFSLLCFLCIPGKFGQNFTCQIYHLANKIVRFN